MIRVCLLVLAGGFAAQHSRVPLGSDMCNAVFVAVAVLLFSGRTRWIAFFLFGFVLFMQAGNRIIDNRLDAQFAGDSMLAQVRIAQFPKVTGVSVSMLIEPLNDSRLPPRSRVTWFNPARIPAIGEIWVLELRLRQPHGNANPGVFSLENWMFREQLHGSGYVVAGKRNQLLRTGTLSWLEAYKRDFIDRAQSHGGASAAVLAAIGVGSQHLISRDQWDRYAKTGSSHLMAISGLHIGLAAAAAFTLIALVTGICRVRGNHLDVATIGAAGFAAAYAFMSGFAVPSQRATIMFGLAAVAFLSRRRPDAARIVALVALVVFTLDPVSLMKPGFSLSFGAVVVLLWFARSYWRGSRGTRCLQILAMQWVLLLGLMPLTVIIFQRISFVAPAVNFLTVPVFSFITVPLTLASMVLHPLWEVASLNLLRLSGASVQLIEWLINAFATFPFASASIAGVDGIGGEIACFVFLPALWVLLPRGWPGRGVAAVGVMALLLHRPTAPAESCFDMHVLDIGQGLAVVVESRQHTLVFDTGPSYRGGGSAAEKVLLPFLKYRGIGVIDWLVVSHADDDHAGGVAALAAHFKLGRVFVGEKLAMVDLDDSHCAAGQSWRADGIDFQFLHPGSEDEQSGNDASCVLSVSAGGHRLLLTGDIEVAGEQAVLSRWPFGAANVVLIPHHGSLTSSSPPFVKRLSPDLAIASVGYANRWGFPKPRVTKRWAGAGAVVLDTASSGAISLRLCAKGGVSQLREERLRQRRFWHAPSKL